MEIEKEKEIIPKYKMIFLGDQNVGKTSIINRFVNDIFEEECQSSIGIDFLNKNAKINNKDINLILYDTAGNEKYRSLIPTYSRDANIFLIIYDITNKDSFINIGDRLNDISKNKDYIPVLIGNKKDLENDRAVTIKEGEDFAKEKGFIFSEVSSKTGEGIEDLFYKKVFPAMITKFNIGKDSIEIINDLINQNNKVKLDENIMIDPKNKCYSKGHEEIMPNYYCPQCKIYMCKKCEISHSKLLKNHEIFLIGKNKKEILQAFAKKKIIKKN
jgi:small GTP-binding protein